MTKLLKTHYREGGRAICGAGYFPLKVSTKTDWYAASNKCINCGKIIQKRSIIK